MPYTTLGKNVMLDALAAEMTYASLLKAEGAKSITGVASTDVITSNAHGYSNGDLVVLTGLTGGAGLTASTPYFVISQTTNTFQVSLTPGGAAANFTTDLSAGSAQRLVELSGGAPAYARKAVAYATAAGGVIDDSTNGATFDVPALAQVDYVGFNSAITAGDLLAIAAVTQETFGAQGTYTLTDAKHDLNS